jgi:hypothetical protein
MIVESLDTYAIFEVGGFCTEFAIRAKDFWHKPARNVGGCLENRLNTKSDNARSLELEKITLVTVDGAFDLEIDLVVTYK